MSEHRVTMLGASWRRFEDPARSRDPRIRELVSALASLPAPEPRPEFRAELRAQLVAIAPRIIAESAQDATPLIDIVPSKAAAPAHRTGTAARPRHSDSVLVRVRNLRLGRPLVVAASVIVAFAMVLAGAVAMSKKALPGDALYGLKRASESWQLATAGSNTDKARDYLKFAQTRVGEASSLASRATASAAGHGPQAGGVDAHTASLITSTLASSDHDVASAATLLGAQAVSSKSAAPLSVMTGWAPGQLTRLHSLAAALPAGALRTRTEASAGLVSEALQRANQLAPKVATGCLDPSAKDSLGQLPIGSCTSTPTTTPATTPHSSPKPHHAKTSAGGTKGTSSSGTVAPQPPASSGTSGTPNPSSSGIINLPTGLPPLPLPTTSLPVSINTCSLSANLGIIGVGVGLC